MAWNQLECKVCTNDVTVGIDYPDYEDNEFRLEVTCGECIRNASANTIS